MSKSQFLDPSIVTHVADIVVAILKLPKQCKGDVAAYQNKLLYCACRELEKLIRIDRSMAADAAARSVGIENLSELKWTDTKRISKLHDVGFHFEHSMPVGEMVNQLLALKNPAKQEIEQILNAAYVAWVTKDEDNLLSKKGYRSKRPNWRSAYKEVGIRLIEDCVDEHALTEQNRAPLLISP